jgi:hypothetical protein
MGCGTVEPGREIEEGVDTRGGVGGGADVVLGGGGGGARKKN